MVKRKKFSSYTRETIGSRQNWLCNTCEMILQPSFHLDHITPLYLGGDNLNMNLQALCPGCHTSKTVYENRLSSAKAREAKTGKSRFFDCSSYFYLPQCKRRK